MTELHSNDIIHIKSSRSELNGHALIRSITETEITLQIPPNHEYTLRIHDRKIDDIDEIRVVYISDQKHYGYAEQRGFVKETSICIVFVDDAEVCGVIKNTEEDMIEVETDQGMLYIDFKYVESLPDGIKDIYIDNKIVIEDEEEYILLPDNVTRYTLEKQLNDLMDKLMSKTQKTSSQIQHVNKIVQRFKQLKLLFSDEHQLPLFPKKVNPYPYVKWIVPIIENKRILYTSSDEVDEMLQQYKEDPTKSFHELYTSLLSDLPFENDRQGMEVTHTGLTFIKKDKVVRCKKDDYDTKDASWIPQVVLKPYKYGLVEKLKVNSYVVFPDFIPYTSGFMPSTPLLEKIKYNMIPKRLNFKSYKKLSSCTVPLSNILDEIPPFYSVHECIQYLEPYFIYQQDLTVKDLDKILVKLKQHISSYHYSVSFPSYQSSTPTLHDDALYKLTQISAGEQYVSMLSQDYGKLQVAIMRDHIQLDYSSTIDEFVEKPESVIPPVVKIYQSIKDLKSDKHPVYDKEADTTNYDEMESYTTPKSMMQYLIFEKKMSPEQAKLYTPGFLKQQRIVVNGEYAKLGNQYYKRINDAWSLDESCYGPYPCTSNEPECTDDCVDITFRLKENLKHMIHEYKINTYSSEIKLKEDLSSLKQKLMNQLTLIQHINHEILLKYNHKKLALFSSSSMITISPNQPLFLYLLQKPHQEKYTELLSFINLHTRLANKNEDPSWFYCIMTNTKLVPIEYKNLADVHKNIKEYNDYVDVLIKRDVITLDDEVNYVFKHNGYPIGPKLFSVTFDDQVRSDVFDPEIVFSLPRPIHPDASMIIQMLSDLSIIIEDSQIPKYFNFIAQDMDKIDRANYLLFCIAYLVTLTQLNQDAVLDKIKKRMKAKLDANEITDKTIKVALKIVNSKHLIQQLMRTRIKKQGHLKKHTIWDTFLPPLHVKYLEKTAFNPTSASMNILFFNDEAVSKKEPLIPGNPKINTCEFTVNKQIDVLRSQFTPFAYKPYHPHVLFHFIPNRIDCSGKPSYPKIDNKPKSVFIYLQHTHKTVEIPFTPDLTVLEIKQFILFSEHIPVKDQTLMMEDKEAKHIIPWATYTLLFTDKSYKTMLQTSMDEVGKLVNLKTFYKPTTSVSYVKSFILFMLKLIPSLLSHPNTTDLVLPPTVRSLISHKHHDDLLAMSKQEIIYKIMTTYKEGLMLEKLKQFDSSMILKRVHDPHDKDTIYEMYYYVFEIFKLYLSDERSIQFIKLLIDTFIKDRDIIFLDNSMIKHKTLAYKVIEADVKNEKLHALPPDVRYMENELENKNLKREAQLARKQNFDSDAWDIARRVTENIVDKMNEADQGTDGNMDEDNYGDD